MCMSTPCDVVVSIVAYIISDTCTHCKCATTRVAFDSTSFKFEKHDGSSPYMSALLYNV